MKYDIPNIITNRDTAEQKTNWFLVCLLGFYILTIPLFSFQETGNLISKILGYVLALTVLIKCIFEGLRFERGFLVLIVWFLWSLTGFFVCPSVPWLILSLSTFVQLFILYFLVIQVAYNYNNWKYIAIFFVLSVYLSVFYFYAKGDIVLAQEEGGRLESLIGSNGTALLIHHGLIIQLILFETAKSKCLKIFSVCLLPLQAVVIISTGSKKGIIFFVLIICLWILLLHWRQILTKPLFGVFIWVLTIVFLYWVMISMQDTVLFDRLLDMQVVLEGARGGDDARLSMSIEAIEVFKSSPIFGIGLDSQRFFSSFKTYSHNAYLELLTGGGLFGFLLMIFFYLTILFRSLRYYSRGDNFARSYSLMVFIYLIYLVGIFFVSPLYSIKFHWVVNALIVSFFLNIEDKYIENNTVH